MIPTHSHRTPDFHLKLLLSSHLLLLEAVERKQPRMKPTSPEVITMSGGIIGGGRGFDSGQLGLGLGIGDWLTGH